MKKKAAVILSGCGYLDGTEITEAISVFICLSEQNIDYQVFAPKMNISPTAHFDESLSELSPRNVLEESSRLSRGKISNLDELNPSQFDGIVFPGGYGVVKHLCSWAQDGSRCSVNNDIKLIIETFFKKSKPILALCIAPALIARILGQIKPISLTIGNDTATAQEIEKTGCEHINCEVTDFITDRESKVISSPAYMYEAHPHEVFTGIKKAIKEFCEMA